jgi:hypothetical protein
MHGNTQDHREMIKQTLRPLRRYDNQYNARVAMHLIDPMADLSSFSLSPGSISRSTGASLEYEGNRF